MESTGSKGELIKSILILAGIPLAFSVANYLIARITDRKISDLRDQIQETSPDSMEFAGIDGGDEDVSNHIEKTHNMDHLKDLIYSLRSKLEELQEHERDIEIRFFHYNDLKDQERALMEVQNGLLIEKERAEFLEKEVSSMEAENKRFDEMVIEFLKALDELESSRFENGLLRRRVKKLLKKTRENSRLMRKQSLKIETREAELKRKEKMIHGFENEVQEMLEMIRRLGDEKNKVLNKLEMTEKAVSSKDEEEMILMENYNRVVNELENLRKERAAEVKELVYLRWCHACLKHELTRRNQLEQERKSDCELTNDPRLTDFGGDGVREECIGNDSDNESVVHHNEPFFRPVIGDERHPKRPWLVRKLKKWVEGNEKEKNQEAKCFGSHSVVDEGEERHSEGRKSFSSA